jgi:hypothetical protein
MIFFNSVLAGTAFVSMFTLLGIRDEPERIATAIERGGPWGEGL